MTPKTVIFILSMFVFLCAAAAFALALFANYLLNRNGRLELQNEYKTELACVLNNKLDELQKDYNELENDYKKIIERMKSNE